MQKKNDTIIREARTITKWNKTRFNRAFRRTARQITLGKGCEYKKTNYCAMLKTMA